ncbi:hypothetical protein [Rathayibacter sp. VKM Ac-2926]|uniref:hypothetical protein n=1 Tax=Rathayibacter sp. VKM Ac-2926 TaxID=2929477 RepID=UPI001FB2914F|nr:hypothetical protein [Rathayibacter sp. VKM Ac-2926]MCJ1704086.1 hypothetical protein [Rathayibacter sp. VKM Ac-2926]
MRTSDEPQREGIRRGLDPLHERHRRFALHALEVTDPEGARAEDVDLVFGLVESIVSQRYWGEQEDRAAYGRSIARGCLRLVGVGEPDIETAAISAADVLARYDTGGPPHVQ